LNCQIYLATYGENKERDKKLFKIIYGTKFDNEKAWVCAEFPGYSSTTPLPKLISMEDLIVHLTSKKSVLRTKSEMRFRDVHGTRYQYLATTDPLALHITLSQYTTFTNHDDLFAALVKSYSPETINISDNSSLRQVRKRVIQFLLCWIVNYDFIQQKITQLDGFLELLPLQHANMLQQAIQNKKVEKKDKVWDDEKYFKINPPPKPIAQKIGPVDLLSFDPKEIARQLCLLELQLIRKINYQELVGAKWHIGSKDRNICANVLDSISSFEKTTHWVVQTILDCPNLKKRIKMVSHFIKIAKELVALHNYQSAVKFASAMQTTSISRLKITFEGLSKKCKSSLKALLELYSSAGSFKSFREAVKNIPINSPGIPFLGMSLTDLTFVNDGNASFIDTNINFRKLLQVWSIISGYLSHQAVPYCFVVVPEIQNYLVNGLNAPFNEQVSYEKSLALEPRL